MGRKINSEDDMNSEEKALEALDREIREAELKRRREDPEWGFYPRVQAKEIALEELHDLRDRHPEARVKINAMIDNILEDRGKLFVSKYEDECTCGVVINQHSPEMAEKCIADATKIITGGE
jgi:hypothetical protein